MVGSKMAMTISTPPMVGCRSSSGATFWPVVAHKLADLELAQLLNHPWAG